jgi:hypothetical protein
MEISNLEPILISNIIGIIIGLFSKQLIWCYKKLRFSYKNKKSKKNIFEYDPKVDDIVTLNQWSYERSIQERYMKIVFDETRPKQDLIPEEKLCSIAQKYVDLNYTGNTCYLKKYKLDFQDQDIRTQMEFIMEVAPCDYSEHLAIRDYFNENPKVKEEIYNLIKKDPHSYFAQALPSSISVNVVLVSPNNNILALKRSDLVAYGKGDWTIGGFETMLYEKIPSGKKYTLFDLISRGIVEEFKLNKEDYNPRIFIPWMGINMKNMAVLYVGLVYLNISEAEVELKIDNSHSKYEHSLKQWLPFNSIEIKKFIENRKGKYIDLIMEREKDFLRMKLDDIERQIKNIQDNVSDLNTLKKIIIKKKKYQEELKIDLNSENITPEINHIRMKLLFYNGAEKTLMYEKEIIIQTLEKYKLKDNVSWSSLARNTLVETYRVRDFLLNR